MRARRHAVEALELAGGATEEGADAQRVYEQGRYEEKIPPTRKAIPLLVFQWSIGYNLTV